MAKIYSTVVGVVLLLWGVIGLFASSFLGVATTGLQVWLFIVAGALGLWMGLSGKRTKSYAKWSGVIFTLAGLLGFILPGIMDSLTLDSGVVASIVHLVVGLWGLWAGFKGEKSMPAAAPPAA